MPEIPYFRESDTQRIMLDILFVFCRLNPDISYRQGMHEILAPILWVVENDAIELGQSSKTMGEDATIKSVFDAAHIEHDAFTLFCQVMQSAKNFYEQTTHQGAENPIVVRSGKIFTEMLPLVDGQLAQHLQRIDIVPQVFLIRWIRLLFGREFAFDELLTMWDIIFAEDPTLEIVNQISIVMLLHMRWQLVEADYNTAMTLLLKYPAETQGDDFQPQSLVLDAMYLSEHMDYHGGSYLVSKYTGRPLLHNERPATPPALQRNITTFSVPVAGKASSPTRSSNRSSKQPRNIESVLRSTAKNIYARGEELGIGKVVKSAVDEVHRKAQEIRDLQTPSPPSTIRHRAGQGSRGSLGSIAPMARVRALEERSKQLSKLLEGAVTELWSYQKDVADNAVGIEGSEPPGKPNPDLEKLSIAIAKVQFVQVYLDDPSLPMPEDETSKEAKQGRFDQSVPIVQISDEKNGQPDSARGEALFDADAALVEDAGKGVDVLEQPKALSPVAGLADPSTFDDSEADMPAEIPDITIQDASASAKPSATDQGGRPGTPRSRPPLEQSSFSWMLGQQSGSTGKPFDDASPFPPEHARSRANLFGGAGDDDSGKAARRGSNKDTKRPNDFGEAQEFDMGSLRHGRKKP